MCPDLKLQIPPALAESTVLQVWQSPEAVMWAAGTAGLYARLPDGWQRVDNLPAQAVVSVLAAGKLILAAEMDGAAYYSPDRGRAWYTCVMPQTGAPVTCFAASPNLAQDGVLLAGTQGGGMLRSRDGGRLWQLANFGLHSFQINALAVAGAWQRREDVFAASGDGVYRSPNGGRAWKASGLSGESVLSLAVSPNFSHDGLLLAGLEQGGVYGSHDGGLNWQALDTGADPDLAVNAVLIQPDGSLLAAVSEAGLLSAAGADAAWQAVPGAPETIFSLCGSPVWAGALEQGLWYAG